MPTNDNLTEHQSVKEPPVSQSQTRPDDRFGRILDAVPTAMVMIDRERRIQLVNIQTEQLFGYPRTELLGQKIELLIPERYCSQHPQHVSAFFSAPVLRPMGAGRDLWGRRKDGREVPIEIGLNPVTTADETFVLASIVDITERKQAMQALRESEERFRQMAETIQEVFWLVDAETFNVLYVSPAYETIWGRNSESLYRTSSEWTDAIHPDDRDRVVAFFFAAALTGEYDTEYCLVRPDGSKRWIHDRGFPIRGSDGSITRIAGIAKDITDRKRIEQALGTSNEELEAFCYSVSHDLRAPLRHIDGFSQAVLEDYSDVLSADGQDMLRMIREAANKMGTLIDDLLSLSRVTRREMQVEEIDLDKLVADVINELKENTPGCAAQFVVNTQGVVPGDRRMLRLAIFNLLENAVKFSTSKQPAIVSFGSQRTEKGPVFFVRDNGVGFNMKFADKLFVPFQRLHRDEEFPGTGIGLAITKRVIHRHGGRVWADSIEGQGATFFFTIGRELRLTVDDDLIPDASITTNK